MRKYFFIVLTLTAVACKKNSSRTNSCGTAQDASKPYQPLTPGDYWRYTAYFDAVDSTNHNEEFIVSDSTIYEFGKTYYKVSAVNYRGFTGYTHELYYSNYNGNIYEIVDGLHELLPLKANAAINEIWSDTTYDTHWYNRIEYKIINRDLTRKVNGVTYTNVLEVKYNVYYDSVYNGTFDSLNAIDFYTFYAKGVGEIESIDSIDIAPGLELKYGQMECFTIH